MKSISRQLLFLAIGAAILWLVAAKWIGLNVPIVGKSVPSPELLGNRIEVPDGFSIALFADDLPGARMLRMTQNGDLLVSLPRSGRIALVERDADGDGKADGRRDLVTGLNQPHGIDLHQGWLYIAETHAVGRIRFNDKERTTSGQHQRLIENLPAGGNHWSKSIRFGPDGWLYLSIGSSCNVCVEKDSRRAAILRFRDDGSQGETYATGLRNTVGIAWRPGTNDLYGVDNGRDLLGDDFPPCELNRIEQGHFYGWPYANGSNLPDPDFGEGNAEKIRNSVAPAHEFQAHVAPLGITFLRGKNLPKEYQGAALVALHGSWNRSEKIGYEVVSLHFQPDGSIEEKPFVKGFENNDDVIGRPVDIVEANDGAIYLSDDYTGSIYRVAYSESMLGATPK